MRRLAFVTGAGMLIALLVVLQRPVRYSTGGFDEAGTIGFGGDEFTSGW